MLILVLGLVLFLGAHSVRIFAPEWRERLITVVGSGAWRGMYSLTALVGFALIVWGYTLAWPAAPLVYEPPRWMKHITLVLMWPAFVLLVASEMPAGRIKAAARHPMLAAVKIWAFAHLLANGDLAALVLFGAFLAWAVLDRISLKRRGDAGPAAGPASRDIAALAGGSVLYALFVWKLHLWLFGVGPVA